MWKERPSMSLEITEITVLAIFRNKFLKRQTCLWVLDTELNSSEESLGRHVLTSIAAELCLISPMNDDGVSKLTSVSFNIYRHVIIKNGHDENMKENIFICAVIFTSCVPVQRGDCLDKPCVWACWSVSTGVSAHKDGNSLSLEISKTQLCKVPRIMI